MMASSDPDYGWGIGLQCLTGYDCRGHAAPYIANLANSFTRERSADRRGRGYGDADIARVLNKLGRRAGKGKPWSDVAVKTARRNHAIDGRRETLADPELLTLQAAARYTGTSDTTIKKLVDAGVLPMRQLVPFAPWEIRRADLEAEPVRAILERLKRTGRVKLDIEALPF